MMTRRSAFLPAHLALGFAIVLASGCDSRVLLVGNNPDATGNAGTSGAAGSGPGGTAGTMASGGTTGVGGTWASPVADAGIPLDAWIAFDSDGGGFNRDIFVIRADGTDAGG